MRKFILPIAFILGAALAGFMLDSCTGSAQAAPDEPSLRDVFKDKFLIGSSVNDRQVAGLDPGADSIVRKHFSTLVAENVMKSESLNPAQGVYNWAPADSFVAYANRRGVNVVGHCLVWHSQLASWFAVDADGKYVSADTLKARMRTYITDVVTRYKGKVDGWDVVNEAILEDGSYRKSPFYEILGEEFIPYAFQLAHEADPDAALYINDYGMNNPAKRDKYVQIVNDLKKRGLRIDAIGMQGHMGMDYPEFDEFEQSIVAFAGTGCNVMITEWDMSALPTVHHSANIADTVAFKASFNPYPDSLPADIDSIWNSRMGKFMDIILKHSDAVSRVNFWGISDGDSWKNDWPIHGRKEYPLAFDRDYKMKPFLQRTIEKLASSATTEN